MGSSIANPSYVVSCYWCINCFVFIDKFDFVVACLPVTSRSLLIPFCQICPSILICFFPRPVPPEKSTWRLPHIGPSETTLTKPRHEETQKSALCFLLETAPAAAPLDDSHNNNNQHGKGAGFSPGIYGPLSVAFTCTISSIPCAPCLGDYSPKRGARESGSQHPAPDEGGSSLKLPARGAGIELAPLAPAWHILKLRFRGD